MTKIIVKRKEVIFNTILLLMVVSIYQINSFNRVYEFINTSVVEKGRSIANTGSRFLHRVGPPFKITEITESEVGAGWRKLLVSRDGKTKEYLLRSEIWREYMDIGGVESVLGSPINNEYTWFDGKRQDFERGHWLYWSDKTGVKMDYNPYGKISSEETTPQAPIFSQGKPAVEWTEWSKDKYFITQDFGVNGHLGQDLAFNGNPNPGYEIRPVAAGKVVFSGWTGPNNWGNMVLIRHSLKDGQHYYSQYAHLCDLPQVLVGQQVHKGTILGYVGTTGKSTGPHLDLQIKELPEPEQNANDVIKLKDIGTGYTKNRTPFVGNVNIDYQTGIVYYKPSYFISNFNNGSVLIGYRLKSE